MVLREGSVGVVSVSCPSQLLPCRIGGVGTVSSCFVVVVCTLVALAHQIWVAWYARANSCSGVGGQVVQGPPKIVVPLPRHIGQVVVGQIWMTKAQMWRQQIMA